MANTTKVLG